MSATRDALVSARVPRDLRDALERLANARGVDLSVIARAALRAYADHHDLAIPHGLAYGPGLLAGSDAGAHRRHGTPTEIAAALKVAPRIGSQRRMVLELYEAAAARGLTADEVCASLPRYPVNGLARRVTDLRQGGLVAPRAVYGRSALAPDEDILTDLPATVVRTTRAGAHATVYAITRHGRLELEAARDRERKTAA